MEKAKKKGKKPGRLGRLVKKPGKKPAGRVKQPAKPAEKIKLDRHLAARGGVSRRRAARLISEGHALINGRRADSPGALIDPRRDKIQLMGREVKAGPAAPIYLMLNKPEKSLTSTTDHKGRRTVMDFIGRQKSRVFPVGRLDWDSEGLLLLTSDGEFAQKILHPRHQTAKTYLAQIQGKTSPSQRARLLKGVSLPGGARARALHKAAPPLRRLQGMAENHHSRGEKPADSDDASKNRLSGQQAAADSHRPPETEKAPKGGLHPPKKRGGGKSPPPPKRAFQAGTASMAVQTNRELDQRPPNQFKREAAAPKALRLKQPPRRAKKPMQPPDKSKAAAKGAPLPVLNRLSPQPSGPPKFFVALTDDSGKKFALSDPRALRALVACMDMEAAIGGAASHWGGPAGFAEIMSGVFGLAFDEAGGAGLPYFERFHIINDAGHCENGLYALKFNYGMAGIRLADLKNFRSLKSRLTGHGERHVFPKGVYLSNGPLGSTAAQAQGLAMADRLLGRKRLCILTISDGACMEGEAKESFAAIPGLAARGQISPFLMIISDNNRKLSGPIDGDSFSLQPVFQSLKSLGWDTRVIPRGNNLREVFLGIQKAFQDLLKKGRPAEAPPIALAAKTIKGFGVRATETSRSGGHGFPLKDPMGLRAFVEEIYGGAAPPPLIADWIKELESKAGPAAQKPKKIPAA